MGVHGKLHVMHALNMIPAPKTHSKKITPAFARSSYWVRAPCSGILHPFKALGRKVKEGELLAKIGNPTGIEEYKLHSPLSGIIIGKSNMPMVHEGAALFHIACFEQLKSVAQQIEYLQESYDDIPPPVEPL